MVLAFILSEPIKFHFCQNTYTFGNSVGCFDRFPEVAVSVLLPFFPLFLFSLITYKLRDEVFNSWVHFVYWWIPLSIVLTLIMPDGQGGSFGLPSLIDKGVVAFLVSAIFVIVSIGIIFARLAKPGK